MLVPLKDDNPLQVIRFQVVTALIVAVNVVIFFFTGALARPEFSSAIASAYGVVPVELFSPGMIVPMSLEPVPEPVTLITYMFLHGGWLHLLFNMAFLWVFADNVEDAFGHVGFLLFYVLCGIAGGLMHAIMQPLSQLPVIGASGAVSGVLGAYILLFPFLPSGAVPHPGNHRAGRLVRAAGAGRLHAGRGRPARGLVGPHRRLRHRPAADIAPALAAAGADMKA